MTIIEPSIATWYDVSLRLVGAGTSIKVFAPLTSEWVLPVERDFLTYATHSRLKRRYVVTNPDRPDANEEQFLRYLHSLGWQVMWLNSPRSVVGILIDDEVAFVAAGSGKAFAITDSQVLQGIVEHFDRSWEIGSTRVGARIIFDDVLATAGPQPAPRIQLATQEQWDSILRSLTRSPEDVYSMDPRRFEELVAELAQRDKPDGLVRLTPSSNDGGRDVMVFHDSALGRHLFLIECKRYAPDRPIEVGLVRQLYGVVEGERASAGALVTSSYFTKPAKAWPSEMKVEYRLALKDFDDLTTWVRRHAPMAV